MFLELGVETSAETITVLSICVRVIPRILTQIIESLCILNNSLVALSECQKFIQFSLHKSFWNMMASKSSLELIPGDNVVSQKHSMVIVPPQMNRIAELLCCKVSFVLLGAWNMKECKLGLNGANPSISI